MAGLKWRTVVIVGTGKISSKAMELASADALMDTLSMLNPMAKEVMAAYLSVLLLILILKMVLQLQTMALRCLQTR